MALKLRVLFAILLLVGFSFAVSESWKQDYIIITLLIVLLMATGAYAVLWWLPPGIAWIGRRVAGAIAKLRATPVRRGRLQRHIFRGAFDYQFSPALKRSFWFVVIGLILRAVRMQETADVKDVQVTVEYLGQLQSTHGFQTAFMSGW